MTGPLWVILTLIGFLSIVLGAYGLALRIVYDRADHSMIRIIRPGAIVLCCVLIVAGLAMIRIASA